MNNVARPFESFPSAPNWFGADISAICKSLELYVYASRNKIVALNSNTLRVRYTFIASQHKLHAIAVHDRTLATTGQDKTVRCWNLETGEFENGHIRHQSEVNALGWAKDGTLLISGDKTGQLSIWDKSQGTITSKIHINNTIRCIRQTVIGNEDIVAVGYANGMVIVGKLNTAQQLEIIYRLENQIDEIQSLRWQHVSAESDAWPLLSSGSRDASLVIWDVPKEEVYQKITPPKDNQTTKSQQSRVFTVAAWAIHIPERLFFTTFNGYIMYVDVNKPIPKTNRIKRFMDFHSRSVFGIDLLDDGRCAISHSMDRTVVKWETESMKKTLSLKTIGGIPYSLDVSKADITKMAVALSDSNIKIWDVPISNEAFDRHSHAGEAYKSENIWKGLKGKITKVKWHPVNEGSLVFGTEHGSVTMIDTYSGKSSAFKSYHKSTVYSLDWISHSDAFSLAVMADGSFQGPWLLSCDGKSVLVRDSTKVNKVAVSIDEALWHQNPEWIRSVQEKGILRSDVAVDNDNGLLALGNSNGSVEVYSLKTLRLIYTANNQTNTINCMTWKPKGDGHHSYLATGSADTTICVQYLGDTYDSNLADIPVPASNFTQVYRGHLEAITDIAWQPGAEKEVIASASSDGNILIWSLTHHQVVHCIQTIGRVYSLCWSPIITDILFSGHEDHCIHVWKTKDLPVWDGTQQILRKTINHINLNRGLIGQVSKISTTNATETRDNSSVPVKRVLEHQSPSRQTTAARKKAKVVTENSVFRNMDASLQKRSRINTCYECFEIAANGATAEVDRILKDLLEEALRRLSHLDAQKRDQVIGSCAYKSEQNNTNGPLSLSCALFESKNRVRDMIDHEVNTYSKATSVKPLNGVTDTTTPAVFDPKIVLDVFRNTHDFIEGSEFRSDRATFEDWISLALSPMFSREMWEQKIVQLAAKLDANKHPHGAAMCYLAAFQVYPALDVYRRAKLYKEAIALAKMRLPEGSTIISELFNEWGVDLEANSQYELAAKCYLQSRRAGYEVNTLNALARPNDTIALYWSTAVAFALQDASASERCNLWIADLERQI